MLTNIPTLKVDHVTMSVAGGSPCKVAVVVKSIPGKGEGLVAVNDIPPGDFKAKSKVFDQTLKSQRRGNNRS